MIDSNERDDIFSRRIPDQKSKKERQMQAAPLMNQPRIAGHAAPAPARGQPVPARVAAGTQQQPVQYARAPVVTQQQQMIKRPALQTQAQTQPRLVAGSAMAGVGRGAPLARPPIQQQQQQMYRGPLPPGGQQATPMAPKQQTRRLEPVHPNRLGGAKEPIYMHVKLYETLQAKQEAARQKALNPSSAPMEQIRNAGEFTEATSRKGGTRKPVNQTMSQKLADAFSKSNSRSRSQASLDFGQSSIAGCIHDDSSSSSDEMGGAAKKKRKHKKKAKKAGGSKGSKGSTSRKAGSSRSNTRKTGGTYDNDDAQLAVALANAGGRKRRKGKKHHRKAGARSSRSKSHSKSKSSRSQNIVYSRHHRSHSRSGGKGKAMKDLDVLPLKKKSKSK
jgi:hypothetical protein